MTLTQCRQQLEATLTTAGLRVLPAGQAAPPSCFVVQGSPWVAPESLGAGMRGVSWVVVGVVAVASEAGITDAEALADALVTACRSLPPPWGMPTIEAPGLLGLAGAQYLAFRATVQTII